MKIDIGEEAFALIALENGSLGSPNSGMVMPVGSLIIAVQVVSLGIQAVIAPGYTIGIEDWNDLEYEIASQHPGLFAPQTKTEIIHESILLTN